jgi:transcriptional regulator with XRE-family HTH domain
MTNDRGGKDKTGMGGQRGPFDTLFKGLQDFTGQAWSAATGQQSVNLLDLVMRTPDHLVQLGKAGQYLKDLRKVAGLTVDELASAIQMDNPAALQAIEEGRIPVNIDILYRLGAFHARHDPVGFMMDYSREHAPLLWQMLRLSGLDQLLASAGRELRFLNLYRSREQVRKLPDDEFERMLDFLGGALDLALAFKGDSSPDQNVPKDSVRQASSRQENTQQDKTQKDAAPKPRKAPTKAKPTARSGSAANRSKAKPRGKKSPP